ncbi:hypothetical protein D3C86_1984960 [compost metagenome]
MHIHQTVELVLCDGFNRVKKSISGIIHQAIQTAIFPAGMHHLFKFSTKMIERTGISNVQLQRNGFATFRLNTFTHWRQLQTGCSRSV